MLKNKQPILISGSHRSGTTWVGHVIDSAGDTNYIEEPLNPGHQLNINGFWFNYKALKIWFPAIAFLEEQVYLEGYRKIFDSRYNYLTLKPRTYRAFKYVTKLMLETTYGNRTLLKDPIALFSSSWIYENFNSKNVILIRNPLAFVSSLKKNGWMHDFNDFLVQKEFLKNYLPNHIDTIKKFSNESKSIVEQGILFSNIFNDYIFQLIKKYPDWYFVSLETLSLNPIEEFRTMFQYLEINFSQQTEDYINKTTNAKNSAERSDKNVHVLEKNSKESIYTYKERLTDAEIQLIKEETNTLYNLVTEAINDK
jgi:hypothetical protein